MGKQLGFCPAAKKNKPKRLARQLQPMEEGLSQLGNALNGHSLSRCVTHQLWDKYCPSPLLLSLFFSFLHPSSLLPQYALLSPYNPWYLLPSHLCLVHAYTFQNPTAISNEPWISIISMKVSKHHLAPAFLRIIQLSWGTFVPTPGPGLCLFSDTISTQCLVVYIRVYCEYCAFTQDVRCPELKPLIYTAQ